ncbi:MAG: hypothetical protein CMB99_02170 [Flavobacteriaceae bacterium]|nr:hypothetical protein [Flavobacteriaceae bacterium]
MRGLALNLASMHQTENPRVFSEVGENKQLLIAIVGNWLYILFRFFLFYFDFENNIFFNHFIYI